MNTHSQSEPEFEPPFFAGMDVGGTNIKIGVLDSCGQRLTFSSFPTDDHLGPENAIGRMHECLSQLMPVTGFDYDNIAGIGLGTPGTMDVKRGMILEPPNLPGWRHFAIRQALEDTARKPVTFVNDANAAAYGEYWVGGAKDLSVMALLTLGTGVGGGIVIDDELLVGAFGNAAEIGHVIIDFNDDARTCSCGIRGHLEGYASATAVALRAQQLAGLHSESSLHELGVDIGELTAKHVSIAAELGDEIARQIVKETAEYLARGIAILAHTLDPDSVLLGGAMDFGGAESKLGQEFLETIRERVRPRCMDDSINNMKIEFATLGSDAGWIGAAGLAKRRYDLTRGP